MRSNSAPLSLAGSQLGEMRHICAFFNNDEEEYRILLPFMKDGLKSGDKAVHVLNPEQRQDHLQRLTAAGIDPAVAQRMTRAQYATSLDLGMLQPIVDIAAKYKAVKQPIAATDLVVRLN